MDINLFPCDGRVRVKICGVRTPAQAEALTAMGVHAIGFNFWPGSKRYLAPGDAGWLDALGESVIRVGVFVNEAPDSIRRLLDRGRIDWAQLHGDETPEAVGALQREGYRVYRALRVRDASSLDLVAAYEGPILLDAYVPAEYGGSGATMDWALGAEAVRRFPGRSIVLAGGLHPDNVARAVAEVGPAAVDVASGVESAPGEKDLALCRRFVEEAGCGG